MTVSIIARSSDAVDVVVHDFGGSGRPLLLSHATGFHAHCYVPIADALADHFHCYGLDYRGHGLTRAPQDWAVDWERYGDDAVAAARAVAPDGHLIGFGHSMGGACLLMAAARDPELFDLIIAFEPIVFPTAESPADESPAGEVPRGESPLVAGARRRRAVFDSLDQAYDNYAAKPPLMAFTPEALRNYVDHGFETTDAGVRLRCDPEHEARTFETGGTHRTWNALGEITTPVVVLAGRVDEMSPAAVSEPIATLLPHGSYVHLAHLDHFGPMTHPDEIARLIERAVETELD